MSKYCQFPKMDCRYGAPMGRREYRDDFSSPARCFKVILDTGGYDRGFAYWGFPNNLYCATNNELQIFTRTDSRKAAKEFFKQKYPEIKWIN